MEIGFVGNDRGRLKFDGDEGTWRLGLQKMEVVGEMRKKMQYSLRKCRD